MAKSMRVFGERLKELRIKKNLTQKMLAAVLGVSANTIISYEKAQKNPSLELSKRIALFFGVSLDWLCGIEKKPKETELTYSAVIEKLFELDSLITLKVERGNFGVPDSDGCSKSSVAIIFDFNEWVVLYNFLEEWEKMKALLESNSINNELFELWAKGQLKKYYSYILDASPKFPNTADNNDMPKGS